MAMFKNFKHWLHGLLACFIGGGAGAISGAIGPLVIDPVKFNFNDGFHNILKTMITSFIVCGALNAASYLKQSPLPPEGEDTTFIKKEDIK